MERACRGLTTHRALSWSEKWAEEALPSSPSQISICSTRLLVLRPHLGGHVKVAVPEAQTFMAVPRFAFVLLVLGVVALFSQTSGE